MSELLDMLIPAVEEQMESSETSFVKGTFDRLLGDPEIGAREATKMIAHCLADESERMLEENRPFDLVRYQTLLDVLPTLPE